ncbi:MAG: putative phage tail protein [Pseudomonadota bacterium]
MRATSDQYLSQLMALLPPGAAWPRDPDTLRARLLGAVAEQLAGAHNRLLDLIEEADPRTTQELLTDWERVCGLPDACTGQAETTSERRDRVVARMTARGGQSPAYFTALAAALGYQVTIEECWPLACDDASDGCLNPWPWPLTWFVHAPESTVRLMTCDGAADEPLADWGNQALECTIRRWAPAHTTPIFAYGD